MKKANIKKVICMAVVFATMLTLVACGEEEKETRETKKTTETVETIDDNRETKISTETSEPEATQVTSEPNQTMPSDINVSESTTETSAPSGKYSYTVYAGTEYETTFELETNIEDYIYTVGTSDYLAFDLGRLADDMGWTLWEERYGNEADHEKCVATFMTYCDESKGIETEISFNDRYENEQEQLKEYGIRFYTPGLESYYYAAEEIFGQYERYNAIVTISERNCKYFLDDILRTPAVSYDDIVIITYIMENVKNEPGILPIYANFYKLSTGGDETEKYCAGFYKLP